MPKEKLYLTVTTKPINKASKEKLKAVSYVLTEDDLAEQRLSRIFDEIRKVLECN